ncbi:hypothetical protein KCU95_g6325, partial [Aureobasidium melanogenum]
MSNTTEPPFLDSLRDVGVSINKSAERETIATGKLYISASLENATDEDNNLLRNDYRLKTLIDTYKSLDIGANPTRSGNMLISKFMGITRIYHPFEASGTFCQADGFLAPVAEAVWVNGPIGETLEVLDTGVKQICDLFKALLCQASMYPILICGARWMREQNLLVVLILLVLRVPVEHIAADYMACVQGLQIDPGRFKSRGEADLSQAMVEKKAEWVVAIRKHLDDKYGGAEGYLTRGGVTLEEIGSLREALQASDSRKEADHYKTAEDLDPRYSRYL